MGRFILTCAFFIGAAILVGTIIGVVGEVGLLLIGEGIPLVVGLIRSNIPEGELPIEWKLLILLGLFLVTAFVAAVGGDGGD